MRGTPASRDLLRQSRGSSRAPAAPNRNAARSGPARPSATLARVPHSKQSVRARRHHFARATMPPSGATTGVALPASRSKYVLIGERRKLKIAPRCPGTASRIARPVSSVIAGPFRHPGSGARPYRGIDHVDWGAPGAPASAPWSFQILTACSPKRGSVRIVPDQSPRIIILIAGLCRKQAE